VKKPRTRRLVLLNDVPFPKKDLLDFARYANPLAALIADPSTQLPLTIGIYGRWGTGKTSLMRSIRRALPENGFLHVEFMPWLYSSEESLLIPLLINIRDTLEESPLRHLKSSVARISTVIARITLALTLKTLSVGSLTLKDTDEEIERFNKAQTSPDSSICRLRGELRKLVQEITEKGESRLMIYIDDLDRCLPGKIIELLESIKLFLDTPNTVILLAVDAEIVEYGIRSHYQPYDFAPEKLLSLTADYLDKMVQLPIYLHPLEQKEMLAYLKSLVKDSRLPLREDLMDLLARSLLPNPRKIKRVLNLLSLHSRVANLHLSDEDTLDPALFVRVVLLQQQWPELYTHIRAYPKLPCVVGEVLMGRRNLDQDMFWRDLESECPDIRQVCEQTLKNLSPQFKSIFEPKNIFENVDLRPYLQILG
jgi:hypothetical protein